MQIVAAHCFLGFGRQQIVVDKLLGGLAGKLHYHSCRAVGIHIGVFASYIVVLGIDDFQKYVAGLGIARYAAHISIRDVFLCHFLARTLHQFFFHHVLYLLHLHVFFSLGGDAIHDAHYQAFVFSLFGL